MSRETINTHGGEQAKRATGDRKAGGEVKVEAKEEEENGRGKDRKE